MPIAAFQRLKHWGRAIRRDAQAIYFVARDPRVPRRAKLLAACVAGYALSPIDLIPDFIPVLGYLDDAIIIPLGILAVVRLIPPDIMAEHRAAALAAGGAPVSRAGAIAIIAVWIGAAVIAGWLARDWFWSS
jgi:uncharacterized membrane protein YkvA (DUF1232 family)